MAKDDPPVRYEVHAGHCCQKHGCKYGDPDCPVVLGIIRQDHPCEECREPDVSELLKEALDALEAVTNCRQPRTVAQAHAVLAKYGR